MALKKASNNIIMVLVFVLPIIFYGEESKGNEYFELDDKSPIVEFITNGFLGYVGNYPGYNVNGDERVKYFIETFGQPLNVKKQKKKHWREPGLINNHTTRYFNGLIIETSSEFKGKPYSIERAKVITLENPKYTLYKGIKIGMPFSIFTKKMSVINRKIVNGKFTYEVNIDPGSYKVFIFVSSKGLINKIVWNYLGG